jgi:membrane-bound serine protease (ClpP class)
MSFLLDPNVAYLLLVVGFVLGALALFSPGTGVLEIGAVFAIVLAGFAIYNLPTNLWALLLLIAGIVPFVIAVRKSRSWVWLIPTIALMVVGSIFLFRPEGGVGTMNPGFSAAVSIIAILLLWFIGRKSIDVIKLKPAQNLSDLIGMRGESRTDIENEGTVYVNGEEWTARSEKPIKAGTSIRVVNRDGLVLIVEADKPERSRK